MPQAIDEQAFGKLQVLDVNKPPMKQIPHMEFPKMVFKHPGKGHQHETHKTKIVNNGEELKAALDAGWQTKGHVPVVKGEE